MHLKIIVIIISVLMYLVIYNLLDFQNLFLIKTKSRINKLIRMTDIADFNQATASAGVKDYNYFSFIKVSDSLKRNLMSSGLKLKAEEFVAMWFAITVIPTILYTIFKGFGAMTLLVMLLGFISPLLILNISKRRRIAKFSVQLNDALIIIGNSLRTGFTFRHALARVSEDLPDPISEELRRVIREVNYGAKLEDSLGALANRMNSKELNMINSAVIIQQRTGGNLAEIIDKVSLTISDRIKMKNQIKTLTAQGKTSGIIMALIPVAILLSLFFMSPDYIMVFFTTQIGISIFAFSIFWEFIGFMFIKKLVDIKF
ncbi:MAG: type II secretion system F family protein [Erysipelotrichaceae bacterium]|nr:type II secretion system F family protein [Erysipelotrichaceae bacterium]